MTQPKKDYSVPALEKAIMILNTLAEAGDQSITELHTQLQIPKSTTFVILNTLEKNHLIDKTPDGKFRLGFGLFRLGMNYYKQMDVRNIARPYLESLVSNTPFTCHLAILENNQPVYIDKVEGDGFVRFATMIGQRLPLHSSGVGKALAMGMSNEEIEKSVADRLEPLTDKSHRTLKEVLDDIETARENGYSIEDEQMEEGIRCIGSPIYNTTGKAIASISITALVRDLPASKIHQLGTKVSDTALRISMELGYQSNKS